MSSIMKGLQGPMSEEMDDDEFDAMVARLKQKAAQQEKLRAQGKEPQTKQDPKTGKYYVDFDDEQVKETSSTGQGGGSAGIGGGAGLGITKSPMEKILEKPLGEDTAYAGGGGQGGSAGQSYRKFTPKSAGVSEGAPELLKQEMPLVRHIEKELAQHGYEKGTPEYDQMFKHAMAMYRKFGNVDAIKRGVAEGSIHQGDLYNAVIEYFRSDRGYRNAMILRKKAQAGTSAEELATLLNDFSAKKWGTKLTPSDAVDAVKNIVYPHRFEQGVEEGKLGTALGAIGLGAMMAMNPARADVKTSDVNVSKDGQTTTTSYTTTGAINRQDPVYKAIYKALEADPKIDYNMLHSLSDLNYRNYKQTGKLLPDIVKYFNANGISFEESVSEAGYRGRSSFPRTDAWGRQERAREENRALTRVYRYDPDSGRVKERSVPYNQISQHYAQGWKDFPEDTLRANNIIRSKFDPKKFVQKVGDKWVQVYPYGKPEDVTESPDASAEPMSIEQLATVSDEALDNAYHYGRSSPGNTFGWQANLKSAEFAKKAIESGITDIDKISDAIHRGWNITARAFVQNPDQFDDTAKLKASGKLEAKLAQREKLMNINYAQLPEDEKEKDRVVARALLQAIKGGQAVAEEQAPMFTPEAKMASANNPTGTGWRYYKAKSAGVKESAIMKGLQTEENMNEYELGSTKKIVFSKENPPSLDYLYQQFIHRMLSSENILEPQDWIERVNKHYGLNYTWRDYQNRGRNDHTDNWQKVIKKYIVKIK